MASIFKNHYRSRDLERAVKQDRLREKAMELAALYDELCPDCIQKTWSRRNLEQAAYWANATLRNDTRTTEDDDPEKTKE